MFRELLPDSFRIGAWFINLIYCNNNWHVSRFRMIDSLNGLRHNTIVSSNYKDYNISNLCPARTHSSKCLMTRRIKKYNLFPVCLYNVCAYMLSNASCFPFCYPCLTYGIKKRGLSMVNMSHNSYNRRTSLQCFRNILNLFYVFFQFLLSRNLYLQTKGESYE